MIAEARRWCVFGERGTECERDADLIVQWCRDNGGEAECRSVLDSETNNYGRRIVIRGPHGDVYVKPGQWVVMGEWFELYDSRVGYRDGERREFTVADTDPFVTTT